MHLILGQSNVDCTLHCISIRFPEQESVIDANAKSNATKLYRDCIERTRKGGFECTRNNSSGPVRFDNIFWKWFSFKGRFPRKREGVVCVKSLDGKKIHTLYIDTVNTTHTAVHWAGYTNPVRGGPFTPSVDMFENHPIFRQMATCKINTTFILHALNSDDDFKYTIQENAVATSLKDVKNARIQLEIDHPAGLADNIAKDSILLFNTNANMFSLVAYPVAWNIGVIVLF